MHRIDLASLQYLNIHIWPMFQKPIHNKECKKTKIIQIQELPLVYPVSKFSKQNKYNNPHK
jgi:hypothetical protein